MYFQKTLCLFVFVFFFSFFPKVFAFTVVDADITENTTWTQSQGPYVVATSIIVAPEASLSIEPGVVIKFDYGVSLTVDGALNVLGTDIEPIYFTSYYDDALGGDTNGDGENSFPEKGDWDCILIESSKAQSTLNHANMRYSAEGLLLFDNNFINSDTFESDEGIVVLNSRASFINLTVPVIEILNESDVTIDTANISSFDDYFFPAISVFNGSSLVLKNASIETSKASYVIDIFDNSSAVFDSVKILGSNFQGSALAVFDESSLSIGGGSITNFENGLSVFNNATVDFSNSSMICAHDGVVVFNASSLNLFEGSISCENDGVVIFNESQAVIRETKIHNAGDAGIVAFKNFTPNSIVITKNEITENANGFVVFDTTISAHENNIYNNYISGVTSFTPLSPNQFDFSSNFWGDPSGPNVSTNPDGLGDFIFGDILFTPWCKNSSCLVRNPVIIIPGVLGTEISRPTKNGLEKLWLDLKHNLLDIGDEFMDALQFNPDLTPIDASLVIENVIGKVLFFDYTNGLVEEFQNQGYVEGTDLFLFPYDWRFGVNQQNVDRLKQKIIDILDQTGTEKIDVIAHSTGGLLVKKYVMENPLNNQIGKAIFVGVPNTGAPKAVKALIQGDSFGNFLVAESEMKKISKNLPVAYDLLPSEQYYNVKGSYVKIYKQSGISYTSRDLNYEEINNFLIDDHGLNTQALINAQKLHIPDFDNYDLRIAGVDLYAIDGCKAGTIGKIREVRYHGFLGDYIKYLAPEEIPGDGTVPLESSTNLPINQENKYFVLTGEHGKMLSQEGVKQKIVNIISGSILSTQNNITQDILQCELNGRAISVYSPLSIDVVDQAGNHSGLSQDGVSVENNIPNADYEIMGERKFVYLPTDGGQDYTINIAGTGLGVFTLTDTSIDGNAIEDMRVFNNIPVTPSLLGKVNLAGGTTLSLDTDGDAEIDQTIGPTIVLSKEEAENFLPEETEEEQGTSLENVHVVSTGKMLFSPAIAEQVSSDEEIYEITQKDFSNNFFSTEKIEKIDSKMTVDFEKTEKETDDNMLMANPISSKVIFDYKIVVGILIGLVFILPFAKRIIKL